MLESHVKASCLFSSSLFLIVFLLCLRFLPHAVRFVIVLSQLLHTSASFILSPPFVLKYLFVFHHLSKSPTAFLYFRNKIALDSSQALFLLVAEKSMSSMSSSMGEIYSRYSDADGFLYITYASQEMFGAPQPAGRPPR